MSQSRKLSLMEAKTNAMFGFVTSWLFTFYGLPLFGITPNLIDTSGIAVCYFFISMARSYLVRRVFNGL